MLNSPISCDDAQVLDKSSIDLNAGCIDRIFIRGNQDRTGGLDIFDRDNQGKKLKGARQIDQLAMASFTYILVYIFRSGF